MGMRTLVFLLLLGVTAVATAAPPGTLYITEKAVDTSSANFEKDAKAAARGTLKKSGDSWRLFFVAFLRKAPGAEELNVVLYEPGSKAKEPVSNYPIRTKATAKIVVAEVEVRPEDGAKAGQKYDVRITRLIGGREEVYARTTLELTE